jgi:hypothetical protein
MFLFVDSAVYLLTISVGRVFNFTVGEFTPSVTAFTKVTLPPATPIELLLCRCAAI